MAHKDWFGRKSLTLRSEKIFLKTRTNDEATLNGFPLLTTSNGAVTTLGPFGNVPNANGASLAASTLTLQPANATFPGGVTTGAQSLAGLKTFTNGIALSGNLNMLSYSSFDSGPCTPIIQPSATTLDSFSVGSPSYSIISLDNMHFLFLSGWVCDAITGAGTGVIQLNPDVLIPAAHRPIADVVMALGTFFNNSALVAGRVTVTTTGLILLEEYPGLGPYVVNFGTNQPLCVAYK